jgi:hypothetical protein
MNFQERQAYGESLLLFCVSESSVSRTAEKSKLSRETVINKPDRLYRSTRVAPRNHTVPFWDGYFF